MSIEFSPNKHYQKFSVTSDVFNLVMIKCMNLYLETHPEMIKTRITQNKIIYEIAQFYLNAEKIL